jgi:hypothetical protein
MNPGLRLGCGGSVVGVDVFLVIDVSVLGVVMVVDVVVVDVVVVNVVYIVLRGSL